MIELFEVLIFTTIEMLNFLMAYTVVFGAKLRKDKMYIFLSYILGLIIQVVAYIIADNTWHSIITMFYYLVIPLCWFEKRKGKWFALYPFIWMGMSIINISSTFIWAIIIGIPEGELIKITNLRMLCECTGIFLLMVVFLYQKIRKRKVVEVTLNWKQYLLLFLGIFCSGIFIGGLQLKFKEKELPILQQNILGLSLAIVSVIFIVVCLWHGIIMYQRLDYKRQMESYEEFMIMQEEQIHIIVDKDEKLRKFIHDMNSHMLMLRTYAQKEDYDRLLEYLDDMAQYSSIRNKIVYTGDSAVDAVFREFIEMAQEKGIVITTDINLNSGCKIKSFDLCVIMSNIFKNAIEACEKIEDINNRKIDIKMYAIDNFLEISMENSVTEKIEIVNNKLYTSKTDKRYHGLGTENIRQTVEKYNGKVEFSCDENKFLVEIFMQMDI